MIFDLDYACLNDIRRVELRCALFDYEADEFALRFVSADNGETFTMSDWLAIRDGYSRDIEIPLWARNLAVTLMPRILEMLRTGQPEHVARFV